MSKFHNNNKPGETNIEGSLLLKPSENLKLLVNQFNASPEDNTDPDIDELQTMKIPNKDKSLALFHINVCSLNKNFNKLEHLLSRTNKKFDVIAISETRITQYIYLTNNLTMNNFSVEFTPTESSAGGTLPYVANHLSYKPHLDLNIYKSNKLESTFIEFLNPKKYSIIIGCIYKHHSVDLIDFNTNYLNNLLDKVSKEQKSVFLLGDFNVNLLNYNDHNPTNEFLDSLASNSFVPYILQPIQLTSHSKTLIDNIFSNIISPEAISGNLTSTISDQLPQFMIVPNVFSMFCRNYLPISLLSKIEKILEKLMYKRVYEFLTENSITYELQFGFRQNFSTAHALINLTENIRQALDEGYIGCEIFVDLQIAFDTVDHEILLAKLNHYGIRGISNDWFRSYLSDRQQYISINGYDSGLTKLNCDVPQGSVLGPLLFFAIYQ